jgi:MFS family permease
LGRRYAALVGTVITCIGAAIQTGANGAHLAPYAMMIVGRVVAGFGNAIISTSVPLYQRLVELQAFKILTDKKIVKLLLLVREVDLLS